MILEQTLRQIKPLNESAMEQARQRQGSLLKPLGSLGLLEDISIQMAGITGELFNSIDQRILFLFGADNGVYAEGVASAEQEFTNLLLSSYAKEKTSGINVICQSNGVDLCLIDIGVKGVLDYETIENHRLMEGTNNFAKERAIPEDIVKKAIEIGIDYAVKAKADGYQIIGTGEVGIGNTTTAAACIISALEPATPRRAVGRGAGLTDEAYEKKVNIIEEAIAFHKPNPKDSLDILSKVGGLDIAGLVGVFLGAADCGLPVVIDGVISIAAALLATRLCPATQNYLFPSHLSEEPAYQLAAEYLELEPYLKLNMRLGEGSGCPLAMGIIHNALEIMNQMGTFADLSPNTDYRQGVDH